MARVEWTRQPTAVGVFQVRAAGLQADFPALRALDASPGNLRAATTSFVRRESEVPELQAAVKAHRLVTLTGVGGVGKTRLALEVAARLADEFPNGVWFFELAAVTDPAAVWRAESDCWCSTIASTLSTVSRIWSRRSSPPRRP